MGGSIISTISQSMNYIPDLYRFLGELAQNNERPWFYAHKGDYEHFRALWLADLQRVIDRLALSDPRLKYLQAKDCAYRIYRDTRFSPDKTPYKSFFSAAIGYGGRHHVGAGYYVHMGPAESGLYGGIWCPESACLKKLRKAIVDNIEEFREIIDNPEMLRLYPGWTGPKLKTAPKGYPKDHPEIELLRLTEYGKWHELDMSFFQNEDWPERMADLLAVLRPLNDFINYSLAEEP